MARILIVDDDPNSSAALRLLLRLHGHETWYAPNGTEGLRMACDGPDLIVLDVNMPDMTGHEVCRRLRSAAATRCLPVIILTSNHPTLESHLEGYQFGADMYLHRPLDNRELLACIATLLRAKVARDRVLRDNDRLKTLLEAARSLSGSGSVEGVAVVHGYVPGGYR